MKLLIIVSLLVLSSCCSKPHSSDDGAWTQRNNRGPTTMNEVEGRNLLRSYVYSVNVKGSQND
jgi:hypothetical protein